MQDPRLHFFFCLQERDNDREEYGRGRKKEIGDYGPPTLKVKKILSHLNQADPVVYRRTLCSDFRHLGNMVPLASNLIKSGTEDVR